jgi:hypothetical protein
VGVHREDMAEVMIPEFADMLMDYSEWLDGQGIIKPDHGPGADPRSHSELVDQFIAERITHG